MLSQYKESHSFTFLNLWNWLLLDTSWYNIIDKLICINAHYGNSLLEIYSENTEKYSWDTVLGHATVDSL